MSCKQPLARRRAVHPPLKLKVMRTLELTAPKPVKIQIKLKDGLGLLIMQCHQGHKPPTAVTSLTKLHSISTRFSCITVPPCPSKLSNTANVWATSTRSLSRWKVLRLSFKLRPYSSYYRICLSFDSASQLNRSSSC